METIKLVVRGIFVSRDPESFVTRPTNSVVLDFDGIAVDQRHRGILKLAGVREKPFAPGAVVRNDRQFSAVSIEEMKKLAETLGVPEIKPEWLGANFVFEGCPQLSALPPLSMIIFNGERGGALRVLGKNKPCRAPGEVLQAQYPDRGRLDVAFVKEALDLRGIVGWVHQPATIWVGDTATIHLPRS